MTDLSQLPSAKLHLLQTIVDCLHPIEGVAAIVLGGSYATATQHAQSDFDIGIYYSPESPFSIQDIRHAAEVIAEGGPITVTDFYKWGAWVNGGAWLHTPNGKVDFLYRNLQQVQQTIHEASQGIIHHDYDQQPSNGFYSVIYLAETHICVPLYDPNGLIAALKQQVEVYPPQLKNSIIQNSLWLAEFSLIHAKNFAAQGDVYNVCACLSRIAANLSQALFALNNTYFLREKQISNTINAFRIVPDNYMLDLTAILGHPGTTMEQLQQSVTAMHHLWKKVVSCTKGTYQPRFILT